MVYYWVGHLSQKVFFFNPDDHKYCPYKNYKRIIREE